MAVKRLRQQETVTVLESLPESLQLRILSFLDARHAVQTSVLSKSWVSTWTCVPVLNFSSDSFKQLHVFDDFVLNALSRHQPVKLDRLTFKHAGICTAQMLEQVFDYALSHGVQELEASVAHTILDHENWIWPIRSSDSLTTLKLQSKFVVSCSFLEPRSAASFKNLTSLHLRCVIIRDLDPFSGFPALDKLRLVHCYLRTNGNALNVHAPQLSEFTFFGYCIVRHSEFTTPKLRYFEWRGNFLPPLKARLPVLDTAVIDHNGRCKNQEMIIFSNLLMMFNTLCNAKSLTLSAHVVHLLTLFPRNGCSPFRDLKCLKLDFRVDPIYIKSKLFLSETLKLVSGVKAYFRHKSPHDVDCTIIDPPNAESSSSSSQKSMCDTTRDKQPNRPPHPLRASAQSRPKRMVKKPARFLD